MHGTLPSSEISVTISPIQMDCTGGMRDNLKARIRIQKKIIVRNFLTKLGDSNGMTDFNVNVTGKFKRCLERQVQRGYQNATL